MLAYTLPLPYLLLNVFVIEILIQSPEVGNHQENLYQFLKCSTRPVQLRVVVVVDRGVLKADRS